MIGGFCCFLFLLATVSIYTSLNDDDVMEVRALDDTKIENIEAIPDEVGIKDLTRRCRLTVNTAVFICFR